MRDPETTRLLADVQTAVVAARRGGVTARACIFDAAAAAADPDAAGWPSRPARRVAETAARAVDEPAAPGGEGAAADVAFAADLMLCTPADQQVRTVAELLSCMAALWDELPAPLRDQAATVAAAYTVDPTTLPERVQSALTAHFERRARGSH
jgi:hypothetical protein